MSQRTGGEGLDRDARVLQRPGMPQAIHHRGGIVSAAVRMEEAALGFQNLFRRGPADSGEVSCDHAGFGGMARLKWFHHRAEVFAEAGSVAGGHSEGP